MNQQVELRKRETLLFLQPVKRRYANGTQSDHQETVATATPSERNGCAFNKKNEEDDEVDTTSYFRGFFDETQSFMYQRLANDLGP
jgi:hypothetical protein